MFYLSQILWCSAFFTYHLNFVQCCSSKKIVHNAFLRDSERSNTPCSTSSSDSNERRIWCFSPISTSEMVNQRYYLPTRFLCALRKQDKIIVPKSHQPSCEFVDFLKKLLGFSHDQIVWTSGKSFCMDNDIDPKALYELIALNPHDKWTLMPYSASSSFWKWARNLQRQCHEANITIPTIFGEQESWLETYGNKKILHRRIEDLSVKSVLEQIDSTIPIAKGYYCKNNEELITAYNKLKIENFHANAPNYAAVIKPIYGCSGEGIIFVKSIDAIKNYSFPMGPVILEEELLVDRSDDGFVISPAVHYLGNRLLAEEQTVDQLMKHTTYLGWRESVTTTDFQEKVKIITKKLIEHIKPEGAGGFDFLSVNGSPVLCDVNTGRFNGGHQPRFFLDAYANPTCKWYCWKYTPNVDVSVEEFWGRLEASNAAFHPNASSEGVFPLTYIRGIAGLFIAIANTSERAFELHRIADGILQGEDKVAPVNF